MFRLVPLVLGVVAGLAFGTSAAADLAVDDEATIVNDAIVALIDEQDVVRRLPSGTRPSQRLLTELRTADQAGVAVIDRAEQIGVAFSASVLFVLERMPQPAEGEIRAPIDYDVAIDLLDARLNLLTAGFEPDHLDDDPFAGAVSQQDIVVDFADEADLLWQAVDALEDGDTQRIDFIAEIGAGLGTLPPLIVNALRDRDVDAILDGAQIFESDDAELLDWVEDSIAREHQAVQANTGGSTPSTREDLRDADDAGVALLFVIDERGIDIGTATRLVLGPLRPGETPDGARYDDALDEIADRAGSARTTSGAFEENALESDDTSDELALDDRETTSGNAVDQSGPTGDATSSGGLGSAVWIALGLSMMLALAFGVFAFRRSRERDDFAGMAMTDGLTGLNNRRKFDNDVDTQVGRGNSPTAMLMVDIDHFKQFNDTHGHKVGDDVLRLVGDTIANSVRNRDFAYRYGGEEFCVLLPDTHGDEASIVAERIRSAIAEIQVPVPASLTASVGVSTGPAVELATLIETADAALYDAKANGRNQIAVG